MNEAEEAEGTTAVEAKVKIAKQITTFLPKQNKGVRAA